MKDVGIPRPWDTYCLCSGCHVTDFKTIIRLNEEDFNLELGKMDIINAC